MNQRSIETLPLDGGLLCLDFVNTVHDRTVDNPVDYLNNYDDVLDWALKVNILTLSERKKLKTAAQKKFEAGKKTFERVIEARELLYKIISNTIHKNISGNRLQSRFNLLLSETLPHLQIQIDASYDVQQVWKNRADLFFPLFPVIKSAWDLLTSGRLGRVKECGACGWLFLDQSKNKSRKWCSMETCGSNVKAKRYYYRQKTKREMDSIE